MQIFQDTSKSGEMPTIDSAAKNGSAMNGRNAENGKGEQLDENLYSRQM